MNLPRTASPLALRDRPWSDLGVAWIYSSLEVPSADAVRIALQQLAHARPGHRLFRRLDAPRNRWIPIRRREIDDWIYQIASPLTDYDGDGTATVKRWLAKLEHRPAFQIGLGNNAVAVATPHAFGDGSSNLFVQFELMQAALEGRPPHELIKRPLSFPLTRAILGQTRKEPRWLKVLAPESSRRAAEEPALRDVSAVRKGPDRATSDSLVTAQIGAAALEAMADWRRKHAPEASRASVMFALMRAAIDEAGVECCPAITMMMDSRRWLPPGSLVAGNLVSAISLLPGDAHDPRGYDTELRKLVASKRPLYATAQSALGAACPQFLRGRRPEADGPPELLMSHMRAEFLHHPLRWIGEPEDRGYATISSASGGRSIGHTLGITVFETGPVALMTAQFNPERVDASKLNAALQLLTTAPVHLLSPGAPVAGQLQRGAA